MADFVQKAAVKFAVRKLASPIDSISAFTTLVQDILTNNPWGCTSYVSAGATIPPVVKGAESNTGNMIYEDALAKTVGRITVRAPTQAAFNTDIITILADATIRAAMGAVSRMTVLKMSSALPFIEVKPSEFVPVEG